MKNSLGGNMLQERLDQIKETWMNRNGKSEQEWLDFSPQSQPELDAIVASRDPAEDWNFDSPDAEAQKMEFIFCPDWREMGFRYKGKAEHFRRMAISALESDNPILAGEYLKEVALWSRYATRSFEQEANIRRKISGL